MNKKEIELKFKQAMINFFRFIPPNLNEEVLRMFYNQGMIDANNQWLNIKELK